jgi:predicted DNA-binding protein
MYIRFIKPLYIRLKLESERTGKSIPTIVQEIIAEHYKI